MSAQMRYASSWVIPLTVFIPAFNQPNFGGGCPRQAVDFRDGPQFDESAFDRLERFYFFIPAKSTKREDEIDYLDN